MPKARRPRNKRPHSKKLNIASWHRKCKICGTVVVAPDFSIGMWLHFNKCHPELNKSLSVPKVESQGTKASTSGCQKPPRKRAPRKPRKNLQKSKRKL